jgi:hypothetical protein
MNTLNTLMPESYYISSFNDKLKDGSKPMLKILKPTTCLIKLDRKKNPIML